jgi:hypothetical protein
VGEEHRLWVFENRVHGNILGPKWDEVVGWGRMHNKELRDVYSSPNIIWVIKSRRMRWHSMWHIWGRGEMCTGFWWRNLRERDNLGDTGIGGRIILKLIFKK